MRPIGHRPTGAMVSTCNILMLSNQRRIFFYSLSDSQLMWQMYLHLQAPESGTRSLMVNCELPMFILAELSHKNCCCFFLLFFFFVEDLMPGGACYGLIFP